MAENNDIAHVFGDNYKVTTPGDSFHSAMPKLALDYTVISRDL